MFFERNCPVCGRPARRICGPCWDHLEPGRPGSPIAELDSLTVLVDYDEAVSRIVLEAKNAGRRDLLNLLARRMTERLPVSVAERIDVVTWVPATPSNRRRRGFDQSRILARGVARRLGRPTRRLVSRTGRSQRGLGRAERQAGPGLTPVRGAPSVVLLVDDVATTGSSLRATAKTIRSVGALEVHGLVVARVHA